MDDEEIRKLRFQMAMDQFHASTDEVRRLLQTEVQLAETGFKNGQYTIEAWPTDKQVLDIMNYYTDTALPEWAMNLIWPETMGEGEAWRTARMPMLTRWMDENEVEEKTTLTPEILLYAAGWLQAVRLERTRIGDRSLTRECVWRLMKLAEWQIQNQANEISYGIQLDLRMVVSMGKAFIEALDKVPEGWYEDDDGGADTGVREAPEGEA